MVRQLGTVAHACNLSTWQAEAGGPLKIGQLHLCSETLSQNNSVYVVGVGGSLTLVFLRLVGGKTDCQN